MMQWIKEKIKETVKFVLLLAFLSQSLISAALPCFEMNSFEMNSFEMNSFEMNSFEMNGFEMNGHSATGSASSFSASGSHTLDSNKSHHQSISVKSTSHEGKHGAASSQPVENECLTDCQCEIAGCFSVAILAPAGNSPLPIQSLIQIEQPGWFVRTSFQSSLYRPPIFS